MKYSAEIDGTTREFEIAGADDALVIQQNGADAAATLETAGSDRYVLRIGERIIEGHVIPNDEGYLVIYQGRSYQVAVTDDRSRALSAIGGGKHRAGGGAVKAPMPGLVKSVTVAVGDQVHRGSSLLILEAMKMENDITAQGDGVVKEVRVVAGAKVDQGAVLVVLE